MPGGQEREARGRSREGHRVAADDRERLAPAAPQLLGPLLVERERLLGAVDLQPEPVLATGGDLADHDGSDRAAVGLELHERGVLGRDPALLVGVVACREGVAAACVGPFVERGEETREHARDPVAGDELGQVAPVRSDVGERARGAAEALVDAPVRVVGAQQPVLEIGAVDQAQSRRSPPSRRARGPRARVG